MPLTRLEVTSTPFAGGRVFGDAGDYELLTGRATFAIDPMHPYSAVITDIGLAPRDTVGRVQCVTDVSILRPRDPARRNGRLLLDVVNRGNRGLPRTFDVNPLPAPAGGLDMNDGWLLQRGYTIVACGWQHDVPPGRGLMRIDVPPLVEDGQPIGGRIACRYHVNVATQVQLLADGAHVPYPAADIEEPAATLTVRDNPAGPPQLIPRSDWRFARLEDGRPIPGAEHLYLPAGFQPGKFYEVVYTATGAVPTALGLAATRDLLSFLRYAPASEDNPCAGDITHALAFGSSQSDGFLRTMLRLGLCEDEQGRVALDGLLPNIAGAFNTELNWRFSQPSYYGPYSFSYIFPFADADQRDPATGRTGGMHHLARERGFVPKVVYTNTSAEYWYLHGALAHINLEDDRDAELPDNVRIYHMASGQHGGGTFPLTRERGGVPGPSAIHALNTIDVRPLLRAALVNLDGWVTDGVEPPPSRYPRVDDGTLVPPDALRDRIDRIPGLTLPARRFEAALTCVTGTSASSPTNVTNSTASARGAHCCKVTRMPCSSSEASLHTSCRVITGYPAYQATHDAPRCFSTASLSRHHARVTNTPSAHHDPAVYPVRNRNTPATVSKHIYRASH